MPVIVLAKTFGALVSESHYHSPDKRVAQDSFQNVSAESECNSGLATSDARDSGDR